MRHVAKQAVARMHAILACICRCFRSYKYLVMFVAPRDQTYEEALKEMMERIKTGRALRPAVEVIC